MKKLKIISLIFGATALSIVPVFTSSCSSETIKAEQVIVVGEQSCHVAVQHSFTHRFTAYVLPTEAQQTVKWSLNVDEVNWKIMPYVKISETGVLTVSNVPSDLANSEFIIDVVATDTSSNQASDSFKFKISIDSKLKIVGDSHAIYRNETTNSVGPWTVNADLEGTWEITNYDTAESGESDKYAFKDYFELVQNSTAANIQPYWLTSWTDLERCSYNLNLKFIPEQEEYKDAIEPLDVMFDVFNSDSMNVTPYGKNDGYTITKNEDKVFTIAHYGDMPESSLLWDPNIRIYLTPVTLPSTSQDYYTFGSPIELNDDNNATVDVSSYVERETTTSPFTINIKLKTAFTSGWYYLSMAYQEGVLPIDTECYYYSNFIQVK